MPDAPVRLRPIEEADLDTLGRLEHRPLGQGSLPAAFRSPHARRRRWEEDGWLGGDFSQLAVALPTARWPGS